MVTFLRRRDPADDLAAIYLLERGRRSRANLQRLDRLGLLVRLVRYSISTST
jgi:hypothetical protein